MKFVPMRSLWLTALALAAALPARPAPADLKGFPFTDETLNYNVSWPSGLSLGNVQVTSRKSGPAWRFSLTIDAGVPGFAVKDSYNATATADLCSTIFERESRHGSRRAHERETIDSASGRVMRITVGGGEGSLTVPACTRDALTLLFFARRELGQGKVPPAQRFLFGGLYEMRMEYGGAEKIQLAGKLTDSDKVTCYIKGPSSDFQFEAFYARDAARTPLVIRVPLSTGRFSLELVR